MLSSQPNLKRTLDVILKGTSANSYSYKGVERKFFPKWSGWYTLDNGLDVSENALLSFYDEFFWDKLMCDSFKSQSLVNLLMTFAINSGKKKAISKLNRIIGLPNKDTLDDLSITIVNSSNQDTLFLLLFAELVEFYTSMKAPEKINSLVRVYHDYLNQSSVSLEDISSK